MAERQRDLLGMEGNGGRRESEELAQVWSGGVEEAIRRRGVQAVQAAIVESGPAAAQKDDLSIVFHYPFEWGPGASLWIAVTPASLAEIAAALIKSGTAPEPARSEPRECWQEILDSAAAHLQASHAAARSEKNRAPAGQFASSVSGEAAAVFVVGLILDGHKLPPVFLGISEALVECWRPAALVPVNGTAAQNSPPPPTLDLLLDVELPLSISFGRTYLPLRDILKLSTGSIVELDCPANEYVDVIVNNCTIARGEIVVIEGNYGVRIDEIISRSERMLLQHKKGLHPHRPMRVSA